MADSTDNAAPDVVLKLLKLQDHDRHVRDLERELADIPARKTDELSRLEAHKKKATESEQHLKSEQAEIKKLELETESQREKIAKLRQQQFEIRTNKEYKAIESEIGALEHGIAGIEDRELELMLRVDGARSALEADRKALAQEDVAVQTDVRAWDERESAIRGELQELQGLRSELAAGIPKDWLESYERIFGRKERALVPVEDGICGGCHMQLPPFLIHDARRHTSAVACSYCGRLLY